MCNNICLFTSLVNDHIAHKICTVVEPSSGIFGCNFQIHLFHESDGAQTDHWVENFIKSVLIQRNFIYYHDGCEGKVWVIILGFNVSLWVIG